MNKSKVSTEGETYDSKLHTFKEMDYLKEWRVLSIKLKPHISSINIVSKRSEAA